jgi:hypothetical protein
MAATSRLTSRSPVPRGARPRTTTDGIVRSRSPSRGPSQPSSRKGERPPPKRHDSSGMVLPENYCQVDPGSSETS